MKAINKVISDLLAKDVLAMVVAVAGALIVVAASFSPWAVVAVSLS